MRTRIVIIAVAIAVMATPLAAQDETIGMIELRPFAGVLVPTGDQHRDFSASRLVGFQGALEASKRVHLVASGFWTRSHARYASFTDDRTELLQFDAGAEINAIRRINNDWLLRPFVGGGAGLRMYEYHVTVVSSKPCGAGYGALGFEFQRHIIAARFETRDYVSCFRSPLTGTRFTRNDLGLSIGLAYHLR